jgi:hypothetical protein
MEGFVVSCALVDTVEVVMSKQQRKHNSYERLQARHRRRRRKKALCKRRPKGPVSKEWLFDEHGKVTPRKWQP